MTSATFRMYANKIYRLVLRCVDWILVPIENYFLNLYVRRFPGRFRDRLDASIKRGIQYLESQPALTMDAVASFTLIVNKTLEPRLAGLDEKVHEYCWRWQDPHLRLLDRNYDPEREGARPNSFDEDELSWPEKPILKCLYADKLGLAEDYLEELEANDDDGGYGTTHVLIGCVILKAYSTIPHESVDPIIEKMIASIVREQQRSRIGDIYSERVECLEWLGYDHYVKEAWIFRIIAGQMSNGGWYWNRSLFRPLADQHPTCVALTSLILYREKQIKKNLHHQGPRPSDIGRVYRCSTSNMSDHEKR